MKRMREGSFPYSDSIEPDWKTQRFEAFWRSEGKGRPALQGICKGRPVCHAGPGWLGTLMQKTKSQRFDPCISSKI